MKNKGRLIVEHYEQCFEQHGDTSRGVDWPNEKDATTRYRVMLEVAMGLAGRRFSILDYGCGLGHFFEYLQREHSSLPIDYFGMDASPKFVEHCRKKFKSRKFSIGNAVDEDFVPPRKHYDFIVLNGVFTEKRTLSKKQMMELTAKVTSTLFEHCRVGLAFNVMSKIVDWERDDLFHVGFDEMGRSLAQNLSRHFIVRHDYGLYEYTVYVYKKPVGELWPKS